MAGGHCLRECEPTPSRHVRMAPVQGLLQADHPCIRQSNGAGYLGSGVRTASSEGIHAERLDQPQSIVRRRGTSSLVSQRESATARCCAAVMSRIRAALIPSHAACSASTYSEKMKASPVWK